MTVSKQLSRRSIKRFFVTFALAILPLSGLAMTLPELCALDIEGTYTGKLGPYPVRINIFCLDTERMMATVCPIVTRDGSPGIDLASNLNYSTIDQDQLILSSFDIGNPERREGSSKALLTYAKIDLAQFRSGAIRGYYHSGAMDSFITIEGRRAQGYPRLTPSSRAPLAAKDVIGVYAVQDAGRWKGARMVFDVLAGTPVVSLVDKRIGLVLRFSDGPLWNTSGVFSMATPEGNGGEDDDKKLFSIRGRFSDASNVEFYVISPVNGLEGPFHAARVRPSMTGEAEESDEELLMESRL